ncbi:sel1 repeat family protein [Acetobacteraceae bacterium]|nr:sel1 repeat family protein [Acetobacteraceae bacterium]
MHNVLAAVALGVVFFTSTVCFAASAQLETDSEHIKVTAKPSLLKNQNIKSLEERVKEGDQQAMLDLGGFYERGSGAPKSPSKAAKLYSKAAHRGNMQAEVRLGTLYFDGRGVPQNDAKAVELFQKAAEENDPCAISSLAYAYATGRGVPQDSNMASILFHKAIDLENMQAQTELAAEVEKKEKSFEQKRALNRTFYKQAVNQEYRNVQEATKAFYMAH